MSYPSYLVHFNPFHDKLGKFTFKKGGSIFTPKKTSKNIVDTWKKNEGKSKKVVKISDVANQPSTSTTVTEKKPGSDFRTPELDEEYKKVLDAKIPNYSKLGWYDDDDIDLVEKWGKESVNAADVGLKALNKVGRAGYDEKEGITNSDRCWFMFEDQTVGYPDIAYLACQGKNVDEIKSIMDSNYKCSRANVEFDKQYKYGEINDAFGSWENFEKSAPYPNTSWALNEYGINGEGDPYIEACVEYAKEYTDVKHYISDGENFIMHFNRQHDPKTGKFIFGDGDGDGIANDHAHQKEKVTSSSRNRTYRERTVQKNKVTSSSRNRTYKERPLSKTESKFTRVGTGKAGTISNTLAKTESLFTHVGSGKVSSISSSTVSNGQTSVNHYLSAIGGTTPINQLIYDSRKHLELDPTNPNYEGEKDYAKQEKTTLNDLGTETWKSSIKNGNPSVGGKKKVNLDSTNPNYEYEKDYAKQEKTTLNDLGTEVWKKKFK